MLWAWPKKRKERKKEREREREREKENIRQYWLLLAKCFIYLYDVSVCVKWVQCSVDVGVDISPACSFPWARKAFSGRK